MTEPNQAAAAVLGWRMLVVSAVAIVAAAGLAPLLIPQLSMRAAIRGGIIALMGMLAARLVMWWLLRSKRSRHR